ncbi:ATP-binding cassette domain-containing protein [Bacillus pseudomycoides]|uniref:Bacitracin ABC transporter ATP-binding protein n=1 Tax=Bacillus pseudomycoides TaxID=64104 RepID=A0A2C3P823_9BACI|nr:ATP-binding cassette domain-containing protein [Bacillus pseudomycoides]PDY44685.1 bacitracin ABC transporter ATP-binding protein [Bacillus pseudomycoides]PEA81479.1 bacitracin ABC transporter ATP-binding protein [Bacillus pseudomycoides]PED06140.1 bacitracin ABC transporter ATP-binding protein [Bacillus pseudomycoides]PED68923.1 bacitracin ABC transporter ATP-binding protein [Bacillus pseudomycoides]PEI43919.1 bacitracin ABC transporter ATP-binding protein [Bacillus pseudomycoides]
MEYVLETSHLTKIYDSKTVVDNISLHIKKGEIYGLLGENGAGKTTTIRMIMGLLKPTKGNIYLFGKEFDFNNREVLKKIGVIIEYPGFYGNLNAIDNLRISSNYMDIHDSKAIERVLDIVNLQHARDKKVKNYSLGMKQRLGIARSLLHNPDLLLLDEPTNGLDPAGIREIRKLLIHLAAEHQKTILISSHILSEVQQLANRIGIIHEGKLLKESSMQELEGNFKKHLSLKVDKIDESINILKGMINKLDYQLTPERILINNYVENTAHLNTALVNSGIGVFEIVTLKQSLEDYYMNITGGEK